MDLNKITIVAAMKKRMAWYARRQEVLAQNIANADTPNYVPGEMKKFKFREIVRHEDSNINMTATRPQHLIGRRKRNSAFKVEVVRKPYETAPDGNAVILEEQMMKVGETSLKHKLMTELYKKHMTMFRMALTKN